MAPTGLLKRLLSPTANLASADDGNTVTRYMKLLGAVISLITFFVTTGCGPLSDPTDWESSVATQVNQLGYRNWIVIAEASFPAHNRPGFRQVSSSAEIPEVVDYVLNSIEQHQHVRPRVYQTRELRAVENDFAPGIDEFREQVKASLHSHEPTELDQQSLITLLEAANQNFEVLVIRTPTALPYTSVFMELQPGYWDAESEERLRQKLSLERMERLAPAGR